MREDSSFTLPPAEFDAVRAALASVRAGLVAAPDERALCLEPLIRWLDSDEPLTVPAGAPVPSASSAARLWALTQHLRAYRDDAKALGDVVGAILKHASALPLFARTGLANEARLVSEVLDRVARKILPEPADDTDLSAVLQRTFERRDFLREAPDNVVVELVALLEQHSAQLGEGLEKVEHDLRDAVSILAVRIANVGVAPDVRAKAGAEGDLADYAFLDLPRWCDLVLERRASDEERRESLSAASTCVRRCRVLLKRAHATLVRGSVSVDLVFRLDHAERQLTRLERLLELLDPASPARAALVVQTLRELLDAGAEDTSLRALFAENTRLLARRITEASSSTGEHYIASTSSEYAAMWRSAAMGGAFMSFVCLIKFLLTWAKLPPFFAGLSHGLNYALAFILMQVFHWTLATKQPSMTAATLAAALGERGAGGVQNLVELIGRTARSQFAAIAGNIGALVPVSIALHFAIFYAVGQPFLDEKDAAYALKSHDPLKSGSVLFAALTGVYLWVSSVAAGWFDNWLRYRRLPQALATNRRFKRVLGPPRAEKLGLLVESSAGGFFGSVVFGLLLGLTPAVSGFFGLPLEIRHITLSTATSVMGAAAEMQAGALTAKELGWVLAGLSGIALMNFTVSFSLALAVALRSRDVDLRAFRGLVFAVLRKYLRHPWQLIIPPKQKEEPVAAPPSPAAAADEAAKAT